MMKREMLEKVAVELTEAMGLEPGIDPGLANKDLIDQIREAGTLLGEDDEISADAQEVLSVIGDGEAEIIVEGETSNPVPGPLAKEIAETKKLSELKDMVNSREEFTSLRDSLDSYSGLQGPRMLRSAMYQAIGASEPTASAPAVKPATAKSKAPAGDKDTRGGKRTKKAVILEMIASKNGATIEEMAEVITKEGIDPDLEKNKKIVKLWLSKMGHDTKKAAIEANPRFKA